MPKHFPQQECAIRCNLHGYLALPVFDSNIQLRVGVLELLMSSKYTSYAYEVQQLHNALKTQNLISPQGFDFPSFDVPNESRQNNLDKIHGILKKACEIHRLRLAQTWAVSQHTSFVSHENAIVKSCSSFDTRCVGKVCMSTTDLPFYVQDMSLWPFRKACRERHLDRSCGLVGKALLSRGSCFCGDVTKLSEAEYPLVHNARMNRLTSSFAIYLCSVEADDDYVLEFYLPPDIRDSGQVLNLVQTLKHNIPMSSGFELGDKSCTVLSVNMEPDVIQISSDSVADNFMSSDSELTMANPTNLSIEITSKKRKIESLTEMMTAEISHNSNKKKIRFPVSMGLAYLENQVLRSFELKGKKLRLKYMDEDDDLILIASDDDLMYAVATTGTNNNINLTCLSD
ncbi:putative PB1 domain-containing protein [Helianthus annuus]|nr:putative PB1 domain-containing protein [Helianthus annuus]